MLVVVDGNDGTGKSTIVAILRRMGYEVADRGLPTALTDKPLTPHLSDRIYIILDAPIELCQERLKAAGKDLTEKYHTLTDLAYYRARYQEIATTLPDCMLISTDKPLDLTLQACLGWLKHNDWRFLAPNQTIAYDGLRYVVTGVYKCGPGYTDMIGLTPTNAKPGCAHHEVVSEMLVPTNLLRAAFRAGACIVREQQPE